LDASDDPAVSEVWAQAGPEASSAKASNDAPDSTKRDLLFKVIGKVFPPEFLLLFGPSNSCRAVSLVRGSF
jgi:hypothetical protein